MSAPENNGDSSSNQETQSKTQDTDAFKKGKPSDRELDDLAGNISGVWKRLGIRLGISQDVLEGIAANAEDKPFQMLLRWRNTTTSATSYRDLYDALCHGRVGLNNVAKEFCYISAGEESSNSHSKRELPCSSDHPDAKRSRPAEPFDLKKCQRQLQAIYNTTSKVKTIPWDSNSAVHIDEIYTQLSWVKDDRKASGVTKEILEDYTDIFKGDKHYPIPKRILVYGRPGIGKTVFTQKTTFDWSQQRNEVFRKFDLVLLIKLRDVSNLEDIHAILTTSELLAGDGMISVDDLYHYILGNQEKVLLILDGYDEYTARTSSPVVDIWESRLLRDCYVILTTRKLKSGELTRFSHVQFEINGFVSEAQIKKFARKLLKDEKDVTEFYNFLEEKDLKGMAEIPLFLLMLCLVWNENHARELLKSRADIYTNFIQTLMNHMVEKDAKVKQFRQIGDYKEVLCTLGKLAFDALLQDNLSFPSSKLPKSIFSTKLIEVGLFHVLNESRLNPEKGVYFIHKSVQEFLGAFYLNELLKEESTTCLSEVDSLEKVVKMIEVLKFACELSAEAACALLSHLGIVGKKEGLTEYNFAETPCIEDLSADQEQFLILISQSFFGCSSEKRRDLYPMFLSYVGGVLLINSDQLHSVANEHLLKSAAVSEFIFFSSGEHSEQSYRDLITVVEDLGAVVVSCSGERKASDFLKKYSLESVDDIFLKKEEGTIYLYIARIQYSSVTFYTEMLRELISLPESTQKKKPVGDQSNEQDNSRALCLTENAGSTPDTRATQHCLSCVWRIFDSVMKRQEMETLIEVLPFVTSPREILIYGEGHVTDPVLADTLVSRINFTNRLDWLSLQGISLTAKPAAVIARSLYQAPNLRWLDLSLNPLGEGVSDLTRHLSCAPSLECLDLFCVKMTKKQVNDLTEAVRQSKIRSLLSSYHDLRGNPRPEHEWPSEDYWRMQPWLDPGTLAESKDEREPGSSV